MQQIAEYGSRFDVGAFHTSVHSRSCRDNMRLETQLLEELQSAETELTPADWGEIRQEAIAQMKARRHRQ
jgi:hypothetical protein